MLAGIAVGRERKQIRRQARIDAVLPMAAVLTNGMRITGETRDVSLGGLSFAPTIPGSLAAMTKDEALVCEIEACGDRLSLPATFHATIDGLMRVRFAPKTLLDEAHITQVVMGRADARVDWVAYQLDRPLNSIRNMVLSMRSCRARRMRHCCAMQGSRTSAISMSASHSAAGSPTPDAACRMDLGLHNWQPGCAKLPLLRITPAGSARSPRSALPSPGRARSPRRTVRCPRSPGRSPPRSAGPVSPGRGSRGAVRG